MIWKKRDSKCGFFKRVLVNHLQIDIRLNSIFVQIGAREQCLMKKFLVPFFLFSFITFAYVRSDVFSDLFYLAKDLFSAGEAAIQNLKRQYDYVVRVFADPVISLYVKTVPIAKHGMHRDDVAYVRIGNDLPQEEIDIIQQRKNVNRAAQRALLGDVIDREPLTVNVACSGGGVRALVSALGSLCGLETLKMLDCVTYLALLSGSTWMASWFVYGNSMREYRTMLLPNLTNGLLIRTPAEVKTIADRILLQLSEKKTVTLINLFDALLVNMTFRGFGSEKFTKHLLAQFDNVRSGKMPFFINTAAMIHPKIIGSEWVEFTPIEIGSEYLNAWVPTWAFNRNFRSGVSTDFTFDFPFYLGTYGGAVGLNLDMVYRHSIEKNFSDLPIPVDTIVKNLIESLLGVKLSAKHVIRDTRVQPLVSVFRNFTYAVPQSPLSDDETIELTDGGLKFNNPVSPLLRPGRVPDVLLIFDNSAGEGIFQGNELSKIVEYVTERKLPFPNLSSEEIAAAGRRTITVFKDPNPDVPVVIYMPRYKDVALFDSLKDMPEFERFKPILEPFDPQTCSIESYCNTFNFKYLKDQSEQLSAFTEFNVLASKEVLLDALRFAAERKRK